MNYFFTLVLCLTGFAAYSQWTPQRHLIPERKDNAVVIETEDPDSVAYEKVLNLLSANEWFIESQDRKSFLIKTSDRVIPALISAETCLVIKRTASQPTTIRITGYFKATMGGNVMNGQINYVGAENAIHKKSFYKMQAIGKGYENSNVYYGQVVE